MSLGTELNSGTISDDGENEFFCDTCGARCTRNKHSQLEYGHRIGCPERPESFTISAGSSKHYYDGDDGGASA